MIEALDASRRIKLRINIRPSSIGTVYCGIYGVRVLYRTSKQLYIHPILCLKMLAYYPVRHMPEKGKLSGGGFLIKTLPPLIFFFRCQKID
jgi:hypothetical protein